jgi:hypothetical protein
MLLIDHGFVVSLLLCRSKRKRGRSCWVIEPAPGERDYITLLCTMNSSHPSRQAHKLIPLDFFVPESTSQHPCQD